MPHVPYSGEPNGKGWDSIGRRDAEVRESNEEERNRRIGRGRQAGARGGKDNYQRVGEGAEGIQ